MVSAKIESWFRMEQLSTWGQLVEKVVVVLLVTAFQLGWSTMKWSQRGLVEIILGWWPLELWGFLEFICFGACYRGAVDIIFGWR